MKKVLIYNNPPLSVVHRAQDASLPTLDLPVMIGKMKHSEAWTKGELTAVVLLRSFNKQILLTSIHKGTEIVSFQSGDSITFQIIEGKLLFHAGKQTVTLDKGHVMTVHENIDYSLSTKEETVFLSTIATDYLQNADNE